MDEEAKATEPGTVNPDAPVEEAVADDVYKKQLMKYLEAIDWKLWEIYNIIKNYVETNPNGVQQQVPQPTQPAASAADVAAEQHQIRCDSQQ